MKTRRRIKFTGNLEDLAAYGFTHYPETKWYKDYWQYQKMRVDNNGLICLFSVQTDTMEKFAELVLAGRIEFVTTSSMKYHHILLTDQEYEDLLKKREERR